MTISDRIRDRRKELGMSADELADKLGKTRSTVYRYETDEVDKMPIATLEPLAKALNTTVTYLLGLEDELSQSINQLDENNKKFVLEFIEKLNPKK